MKSKSSIDSYSPGQLEETTLLWSLQVAAGLHTNSTWPYEPPTTCLSSISVPYVVLLHHNWAHFTNLFLCLRIFSFQN